jgi:carbonic anhydrase/acetyltransferase-like protein (isoleucine patch superfamily)
MFMKKLIISLPLLAAAVCTPASAGLIGSAENFTVLSHTYTTTGDSSVVYGNVIADTFATTGANTIINGDFRTGDVLTLGDGTTVTGNAQSVAAGTATANTTVEGDFDVGLVGTIGDNAHIQGNFTSGLSSSLGANSNVDGIWGVGATGVGSASFSATYGSFSSTDPTYITGVTTGIQNDMNAATNNLISAKASLTAMGLGTALASPTMTVDTTYTAGVFSAASWSTTASTTLTLDGQGLDNQMWVFNIEDILAFGGNSTVELFDVGANAQVFWNVSNLVAGGYATLGDGADIVGTIIAEDYVEVGANAFVRNASDGNCAGIYSTKSYVTIGANAVVGGANCSLTTTVPEPETNVLLLAGLGLMGFIKRRRCKKTA